jgi:alanyl-tRNA synthetase
MGMVKQEAVVVLFGNRGEKGQIVFACSKDLPFKMDDLVREAAFAIQGKGGGSPTLAFGGGPAVEEIDKAIQKIFDRIVSQK